GQGREDDQDDQRKVEAWGYRRCEADQIAANPDTGEDGGGRGRRRLFVDLRASHRASGTHAADVRRCPTAFKVSPFGEAGLKEANGSARALSNLERSGNRGLQGCGRTNGNRSLVEQPFRF